MAQDVVKTLTKSWQEMTDADVTSITLQNRGSDEAEFVGTVGAVAPADTAQPQGIVLERGTAVINRAMTDLFPGVAATRVYGRVAAGGEVAQVYVSHA